MKKLLQTTIIVLAGIITLVFVGAGCIQDIVTPAYINTEAAEWANVPPKLFMPYTTLWDAKRVANAIDYKFSLERIKCGYYQNVMNISIVSGEELKSTIFSPDGILSLLMFGGTFTAGSYLISKPKDRKEIADLKNQTS